jgi:methylglutaconyl-CoA hydratase
MEKINNITSTIIAACIEVHNNLGPGLFESVYEEILAYKFQKVGLFFQRQFPIPVFYEEIKMDVGFRADFIIENEVVLEIKSIEAIHPVHKKQLLTYLRLANKQIGLLINFNEEILKNGITRLINKHLNNLSALCVLCAKTNFMAKDLTHGYVDVESHKGITTIEFFHPQSNSLPHRILEALANEIHDAGVDADTKVIILRSGGEKAFCAGASFDELTKIESQKQGFGFFSGFANVINAMRKCPKFIIGRIHGKCVGGGVGLAAAVDYAIALDGAEIKLSELSVGIGPFVVGPAVQRKIGLSCFSQLAIDATMWRNADWARRKGLYSELHSSVESMDESIRRLSHQLSHSSPEAMAEMKKMFWQGTENWDDFLCQRAEISGRLVLSHFTKEAITRFKTKA